MREKTSFFPVAYTDGHQIQYKNINSVVFRALLLNALFERRVLAFLMLR